MAELTHGLLEHCPKKMMCFRTHMTS